MISVLTDVLEESLSVRGDTLAYVEGEHRAPLSEVRNAARHIGQALSAQGLCKQPVVIFMDKSITCIESLLGVSYSGNFYSITDTQTPAPRIEKICQVLSPALVITTEEEKEKAGELFKGLPLLLFEEAMKEDLSPTWEKDRYPVKVLPSDVLCVIFTSGSTGMPKGVVIAHDAMVGYIQIWPEQYRVGEHTRFLSQAPFHFVMASLDLFTPIAYGGCTHIVPQSFYSFPQKLAEYIARERITALNWVPSALLMMSALGALKEADLSSVEAVLFGGEVMPAKHLSAWRKKLPDALFVNGYGSTETVDACLCYVLEKGREFGPGESIPIGRPYPHMDAFLLDEDGHLVSTPGEKGQICARGRSLSLGYYGDREKTAEVFVDNPLCPAYQEKIYKTGDLGYWTEDGLMMYAGRADFQIKHMGHRIELGEIEEAALSLEGIGECACVYDKEKSHILLFYTGARSQEEVGDALREKLPPYMLPWKRKCLPSLPQNSHGKVDRVAILQDLPRYLA